MTNTTNTERNEIDGAQLFWDSQDPSATGWCLRYRLSGTETSDSIDGDEDDTTEDLAERVAETLASYGRADVAVFRGDIKRGRIVVDGGAVVDWRAL